jgi:hypothetical protein
VRLTEIAAAKQSCASPDATNEPDLSGLRVGPDQSNTVPKEGLEPSHPKAQEPKSCVSTSSTTPALLDCLARQARSARIAPWSAPLCRPSPTKSVSARSSSARRGAIRDSHVPLCLARRSILQMQVSLELVDVAGRLHVVLGNRDSAIAFLIDINDKR